MKPAVLVVSSHTETARDLADALASLDVVIEQATSLGQVNRLLQRTGYRVVLTDAELGDGTWRDLLHICCGLSDNPTVVVTSLHADARLWVDAVDAGAADVLRLPLDRPEALRVVGGALEQTTASAAA